MTTTTIYSDTTDGRIASNHGVYATARSGYGLVARTADTGAEGNTHTGQQFTTSYFCWEGFFQFDTSIISDTDIIDSVVFSLYGSYNGSVTDFTIECRLHDWGADLTTADWVAGASLSALTLLATFDTSGFVTTGYNDFTDVAFPANINTTGPTKVLTCSSRMTAGTTPTGEERINSYMADDTSGTKDPKLVIVHHAAVAPDPRLLIHRYVKSQALQRASRW